MTYSLSLGSKINLSNITPAKDQDNIIFGRVVQVILSKDEPGEDLYNEFGKEASINGIFYRDITDSSIANELEAEEDNFSSLPFALCSDPTLKRVPLIGEIVEITTKPKAILGGSGYSYTSYYHYPINIWNNAHHNALPETKADITEIDFGKNTVEIERISTLQPFSGDLILEGRLGQSLRFSGFNNSRSILTTENNIGAPYAILKVGQDPEYNDLMSYVEDINKDLNSIYLTTNHLVPIIKSTAKQDTFRDTPPLDFDKFDSNQIILDSGRIVLHSKQDSLFLNSKNSISFESATTNIDSTQYTSFDAPEMFIGAAATQPAVLGDENEKILNEILDTLDELGKQFAKATTPASAVTVLAGLGAFIPAKVGSIKSKVARIKSKKVKIE